MCGEQPSTRAIFAHTNGSPPRVRGTGRALAGKDSVQGITPACAGNSPYESLFPWEELDHPRVCGEQAFLPVCKAMLDGSPPRVRGTERPFSAESSAARITPACAGNSACKELFEAAQEDHPRVCGEQSWEYTCDPRGRGSPPRVRGTALPDMAGWACTGITPACAGNRANGNNRNRHCRDHPRVCGEQPSSVPASYPRPGSPPRVRGTGVGNHLIGHWLRITPACAGNRKFGSKYAG